MALSLKAFARPAGRLMFRMEELKVMRTLSSSSLHCARGYYGPKGNHPEEPQFPDEYSPDGPPTGKIFDKKPFRMQLEAEKRYFWCTCGHSHTQPLCDGTHKKLWGTAEKKTMPKWRPLPFKVETTKEYWLCNCKQSAKRPFCDGTHKREDIQKAIKS